MKTICVATSTRADYGLLKPLLQLIKNDPDLSLQLLVTGSHLSSQFGFTITEIEQDGFVSQNGLQVETIDMCLSSDSNVGVASSMGLLLSEASKSLVKLAPDMLVVLGDRFEMLAIAIAATLANIPIAHIHGGETTQGATDEAFRHSITKMAYLHFVSTLAYKQRVVQLGEDPKRVFWVGALGVENAKTVPLLTQQELAKSLGISFSKPVCVLTYHPVTLDNNTVQWQIDQLLQAIKTRNDLFFVMTKANADENGQAINKRLEEFAKENSHFAKLFASLGQVRYLSLLAYAALCVGNSSSGILEAPTFHIPTINIGDRQKGRIAAETVIHVGNTSQDILEGMDLALSQPFQTLCQTAQNPYEKSHTAQNILRVIKQTLENWQPSCLKKAFYDMDNLKATSTYSKKWAR